MLSYVICWVLFSSSLIIPLICSILCNKLICPMCFRYYFLVLFYFVNIHGHLCHVKIIFIQLNLSMIYFMVLGFYLLKMYYVLQVYVINMLLFFKISFILYLCVWISKVLIWKKEKICFESINAFTEFSRLQVPSGKRLCLIIIRYTELTKSSYFI